MCRQEVEPEPSLGDSRIVAQFARAGLQVAAISEKWAYGSHEAFNVPPQDRRTADNEKKPNPPLAFGSRPPSQGVEKGASYNFTSRKEAPYKAARDCFRPNLERK